MSPALLGLVMLAAVLVLAVVVNQVQARLGLIEVTLNEGLPPGHQRHEPAEAPTLDAAQTLGPGIHIFLSRTCHACQRLIEELLESPLDTGLASTGGDVHFRFVDRPRPAAAALGDRPGTTLHQDQLDLSVGVGADPLPFGIVVGAHGLLSRGVAPTRRIVLELATDAGLVPTSTGPADRSS